MSRTQIYFLTFSHIDTAWLYFNEDQVGRAISEKIKEGAIKREELFVTTKLAPVHWHVIKDTVVGCLKRLQLDYIDLFLVHGPCALKSPPGGIGSLQEYFAFSQKTENMTAGKLQIYYK